MFRQILNKKSIGDHGLIELDVLTLPVDWNVERILPKGIVSL